jgi:hypothetical protein
MVRPTAGGWIEGGRATFSPEPPRVAGTEMTIHFSLRKSAVAVTRIAAVALTMGVAGCGGCTDDHGAAPMADGPDAGCAAPDPTSTSFYDAVTFLFQSDCASQ